MDKAIGVFRILGKRMDFVDEVEISGTYPSELMTRRDSPYVIPTQ